MEFAPLGKWDESIAAPETSLKEVRLKDLLRQCAELVDSYKRLFDERDANKEGAGC